MKSAKYLLPYILLLSVLVACKKNVDSNKSFLKNPATLAVNCSSPQRYRDTIFTEAQIRIIRNRIFRNSTDYAPGDTVRTPLLYDWYEPMDTDPALMRPVIILLHGGGFTYNPPPHTTSRLDFDYPAKRLARYGFCVASIEYRIDSSLMDTAHYFTQANVNVIYREIYRAVQDARYAVRFAKAAAMASKIDTNYIFMGGGSAGAIISLFAAYLDDNEISPTIIDTSVLGKLDYGTSLPYTGKVRGVMSYSGVITDLNFIQAGSIPSLNIQSKKDNYFPYECGIDYTYQRIYCCGAKSISERLQSLNIPHELILLDDLDYTVTTPSAGNFYSHSHGSVMSSVLSTPAGTIASNFYQNRDADSTAHFLYRTFSPDPCP
jgi:hypothetical protein